MPTEVEQKIDIVTVGNPLLLSKLEETKNIRDLFLQNPMQDTKILKITRNGQAFELSRKTAETIRNKIWGQLVNDFKLPPEQAYSLLGISKTESLHNQTAK